MRCTAHKRKTGEPCGNWAIKGRNVCRLHGGGGNQLAKVVEANTKHGRTSKYAVPVALASYERMAADPDALNLSDEIGLARAVLDKYLSNHEHAERLSDSEAAALMDKIESVSRVVEREAKRRGALSPANMVALMVRIADVIREGIDTHVSSENEREQCWRVIRHGLASLLSGTPS